MRLIVPMLLVALAGGCAATRDAERVMTAAAAAEQRIGAASERALDGVAALASRTGALLDRTGAAVDDARFAIGAVALAGAGTLREGRRALGEVAALLSDARTSVESGGLSRRLLIGLVILAALTLAHSVIAHVRLHRRVSRLARRSDAPPPRA